MIDLVEDVHSLTDFKRKTTKLMSKMKKAGRPLVLTVNGQARLVVLDPARYQRLVELAERAEMAAFLDKSRAQADAGELLPALEAIKSLGQGK